MFDIKSFYEAGSVEDAIFALTADPGSQIISGGTDVLIREREGKDAGKGLVPDISGSIRKLFQYRYISFCNLLFSYRFS